MLNEINISGLYKAKVIKNSLFMNYMHIQIFNSSEKEIQSRKFNIFVGISVGVKPLNEEIAKEYLSWSLENTKDDVIILIADEIAKYNYIVFSKYNENKSLKRAYSDGAEHTKIFEDTISKHFSKEKSRIKIISWKDILSEKYDKAKEIIDKFYEKNIDFQNKINHFLKKYTERREKELSQERLKILSQYILSELPTLLLGIDFENKHYNLLLYPTYIHSGLSELSTNISKGIEFPELKDELNLDKKTVLVEAYIDE